MSRLPALHVFLQARQSRHGTLTLCTHQPAALIAAGAIFGLGGALAVYCARHRELMGTQSDAILRSLGQSLALNIAIGFSTPQIDQW